MRRGGETLARQEEGRAAVLRQIHSPFQVGAFGDLTDRQLLEQCMTGHTESAEPAFTALVERPWADGLAGLSPRAHRFAPG